MDKDVDFRTLQAVADLCAVAAAGAGAAAPRIAPGAGAALDELIQRQDCRIGDNEPTLALLEPLEVAAATPDPDRSTFLTATAILLADCLQGGVSPQGLILNYDLFGPCYREAPNPCRAALLNGFEALAGRLPQRPLPSPSSADRCSTDREAIIRELVAAARAAPEHELVAIARSD